MDTITPAASGAPKSDDNQNRTLLNLASTNSESMSTIGAHPSLLGTATNVADSDNSSSSSSSSSSTNTKDLGTTAQESYSPWDMPPIIQPVASNAETRSISGGGLKGFSTTTTWPHFRSKPHPTISVPPAATSHSRSGFDIAAPSTPPRSTAYSNPEDSDNAMCTPTFGSSNSNYSRRNSAASVMALDTPPPLSLMDLESSSSLSGSSFGSGAGSSSSTLGVVRSADSVLGGTNHGYPFPLFGMRHDASGNLSRRSSRTNSISMESRHVRKPSEDACMSDG
ncbi:hypothetical protein BGZ65_010626, partial [Modicella reniformis]